MDWEQPQLDRFNRVTERDIPILLRASSTEYNFSEIKDKAVKVIESVGLLKENFEFWAQLPQQNRDEINTKIDQISTIFDQMQGFDPKTDNAWGQRNDLVQQFEGQYREIYSYLIERINSYLGQKAYSQELSSKFGKEAKTELAEIRKVRREIEKSYKEVQEAATIAGDVASTATAKSFDDQAAEHKEDAKKWFKGIIGFAFISIIIALTVTYQVIREILSKKTIVDNAEASLFKLAIIAFLYLGFRFLFKNYSAHKHLYTTNKHRANVLKAMEAFRTSATDDPTKNSVLLAAVGAAFSFGETGFITTKEGAGDDGDIMDIVKLASHK